MRWEIPMKDLNKISSKEIFVLTFYLTIALFVGFGNSQLLKISNSTTLITAIVGVIIGFIPIMLVIYLSKFTTDKNIFELLSSKFKVFGKILNLLIGLSVIIMGMVSIWNCVNFAVSQYLSQTPLILIGIIFFLIVCLCVIKGKEVIGRTAIILFPIFIIFTLVAWIGLIPKIEIENIYPILNIKTLDFIKSAIYFPLYATLPMFLFLSIRQNDIVDKENFKKAIIYGYTTAAIFPIIFIFLIISVLGNDFATILAYPEYSLFKKIKAFNFVEKIENFISVIIFIAFFIHNSVGTYFYKNFFKASFNIKSSKTINIVMFSFSMAICIFTIFIFTKSQPLFLLNDYPLVASSIFIVFLIVAIMLTINKFNAKKAKIVDKNA